MNAAPSCTAELHKKLQELELENARLRADNLELRQHEKDKESEERYQLLAENATDIIMRTDLGGLRRYISPACRSILGFEPDELIGTHLKDSVHPDDYTAALAGLDALLSGLREQETIAYRIQHKKGHWVWLEARRRLVRDHQGQPSEIISVLRDISDRVHLEERLRQSQKMEAVGQLTGGIAHDFNNLLTVILSNAELLVEDDADPSTRKNAAIIILEAAERSAELIQHLLSFGRRQALKPVRVSLEHVLRGMTPLLQRTLGEHVELRTRFSHSALSALTDRTLLESAILNLVVNARDAMPEGGTLTVLTGERTARAEEGALPVGQPVVFLTVSDTGTGMTPEVLERAFEPFFTTKDVGQGSGLGLAMVYGFAQQTGSHVSITSSPGKGTSITIVMPGVTSEAIEASSDKRDGSAAGGGNEKILVVEDEPHVLQFVSAQLLSLGYDVTAVSNAPDALDVLERDRGFDLLFTDVVMPKGISGVELSRLARKRLPDLNILLTSGHSQDVFERHGRPDPDIGLLRKPYRRKDLAKAIREALSRGHSPTLVRGQILLVDDQRHNRDVVRRVLVGVGHEVDTAESGSDAVQAVQSKPYDLVLMDVQMPGMDGDEATRVIRQLDHPAHLVPIVALTGNIRPQQIQSLKAVGMNDWLGKPFRRADLLEKVSAWLLPRRAQTLRPPTLPASARRSKNSPPQEITDLMGPEWVETALKQLRHQIEDTFGDEAASLADRRRLARKAHALVAHSALVGYLELSQLCSELENACCTGRNVRAQFRAAFDAANRTLEEL